jgi:ATP-dependent Clp protease ATP-binding subunit ClpB
MLENFKKGVIMPELTKHFRLEFINRFDDTVIFNPLSKDMLKEIGLQEIKSIQDKVSAQGIKLEVKESTLTDFVDKSYNPALGARPLIRMLRENIEDNLAQRIVADTISFNEKVTF